MLECTIDYHFSTFIHIERKAITALWMKWRLLYARMTYQNISERSKVLGQIGKPML